MRRGVLHGRPLVESGCRAVGEAGMRPESGGAVCGAVRFGGLCGENALGLGAVSLTRVSVLLEGVLHGDGGVADVLAVHCCDGGVGMLERGVFDEAVTFGLVCERVTHDVRGVDDVAEGGEGVVEELFVDFVDEVADEEVCADVLGATVQCGVRDADGFGVEFDHV